MVCAVAYNSDDPSSNPAEAKSINVIIGMKWQYCKHVSDNLQIIIIENWI